MKTPEGGSDTNPSSSDSLRVSGRLGWDQHPGVRTGHRLRIGEHAADVFFRVAGSWTYLIVVVAGMVAGAAAVLPGDRHAGGLTDLAVGLSALAVAELSLVLMAGRRAERIATELALYNLDQARRATAIAQDLREEMQRLQADIARIAARTDIAGYPGRRT
jgi:hypothetical protein